MQRDIITQSTQQLGKIGPYWEYKVVQNEISPDEEQEPAFQLPLSGDGSSSSFNALNISG